MGIYPIVDRCHLLSKLLQAGIRSVQLRIKDLSGAQLEQEIQQAVTIANKFQAQLFINDYWRLAMKYAAFGIHLGQTDLLAADLFAIANQGIRLGISTHNVVEFANAVKLQPSYIACGPIMSTTAKAMQDPPIGLAQLRGFCQLSHFPIVAIGGIQAQHLADIKTAGANGAAMISAIINAADPAATAKQMQTIWESAHG